MARRHAPLLAVFLSFLTGGALLFVGSETRLTVENLNRPTGPSLQIKAPQRFELGYVHSMYDRPVEEAFRIEGDRIVLEAVKTDHAGVMQYYGAEDPRDLSRLNRDLGSSFAVRIGLGRGQELRMGERVFRLEDMGQPGDRVRVAVERLALWRRIWTGFRRTAHRNGKRDLQEGGGYPL